MIPIFSFQNIYLFHAWGLTFLSPSASTGSSIGEEKDEVHIASHVFLVFFSIQHRSSLSPQINS